jgi:quercetin dioxygenase-like cupin family protein
VSPNSIPGGFAEPLLHTNVLSPAGRKKSELKKEETSMIIKNLKDVPFADLSGYEGVKKQIVIGPEDGSNEIVLRYFSLGLNGKSPRHSHDFPHLVKIEAGSGMVEDEAGRKRQLKKGDYVFVNSNEVHNFTNTGTEQFDFVCIVPRRGEA